MDKMQKEKPMVKHLKVHFHHSQNSANSSVMKQGLHVAQDSLASQNLHQSQVLNTGRKHHLPHL